MSEVIRPKWLTHGNDYVHDVDTIIDQLRKRWRAPFIEDVWSAKWFRSMVAQAMKDTFAIHEEETEKDEYDIRLLVKPYAILSQFIDAMCDVKSIYHDMDLNLLHSRYAWLHCCESLHVHMRWSSMDT